MSPGPARRHGINLPTTLTDRTPMTDRDAERLNVNLTRAQWREIKQVIGHMWSGPQDVLYDRLDQMDLDEPAGDAA